MQMAQGIYYRTTPKTFVFGVWNLFRVSEFYTCSGQTPISPKHFRLPSIPFTPTRLLLQRHLFQRPSPTYNSQSQLLHHCQLYLSSISQLWTSSSYCHPNTPHSSSDAHFIFVSVLPKAVLCFWWSHRSRK